MKNNRKVIIGLDGVPFGMLSDLSLRGIMPNVKEIIDEGTFKKMASSLPEVSSVAWSSIITGKNPAEHGIFGFTDFEPGTYRITFPNFDALKTPPFWQLSGGKSVIINVPSTYPARELNGVLVSGFVALDLEKAVYPKDLIRELQHMDYRIDVDAGKAHQSMELFLNDLRKTNEARINLCRHLWRKDWDTFMLVFTGTDRLMHFLMDAYEDKDHEFHGAFMAYFKRIDEIIGEIKNSISNEDTLILLSDHGFERLETDVYVNSVLKKSGILNLTDSNAVNLNKLAAGTKAFALDPARIYINMEKKYPRGEVDASDYDKIIKELENIFYSLKYNNQQVIKSIYKKNEIYKGQYVDKAPDLVLLANKGFNLKAALGHDGIYDKGPFTGKHTQDDAFILVNKNSHILENVSVGDVASIVNSLEEVYA